MNLICFIINLWYRIIRATISRILIIKMLHQHLLYLKTIRWCIWNNISNCIFPFFFLIQGFIIILKLIIALEWLVHYLRSKIRTFLLEHVLYDICVFKCWRAENIEFIFATLALISFFILVHRYQIL